MEKSTNLPYNSFPTYLLDRYGDKAYKIPIGLQLTCPNRDGVCGTNGCSFCGEIGAAYEKIPMYLGITEQINIAKKHICVKHNAHKFIPYFQNFSNTYMPLAEFTAYLDAAAKAENVVAVYIATRPDCISDEYLSVMQDIAACYGIDICVELGLQTVNYHTLKQISRGHSLAEFIDAVLRIKRYGLQCCTHLILNLPDDTDEDAIEAAKILSALKVDQVKLHALFIVKGTAMAAQYENNELTLIGRDEYQKRAILFLRYLAPDIVLQRLIGRAQTENTLFSNWSMSWQEIHDGIIRRMKMQNVKQGDMCTYLNGAAVRKFCI